MENHKCRDYFYIIWYINALLSSAPLIWYDLSPLSCPPLTLTGWDCSTRPLLIAVENTLAFIQSHFFSTWQQSMHVFQCLESQLVGKLDCIHLLLLWFFLREKPWMGNLSIWDACWVKCKWLRYASGIWMDKVVELNDFSVNLLWHIFPVAILKYPQCSVVWTSLCNTANLPIQTTMAGILEVGGSLCMCGSVRMCASSRHRTSH